MVQVSLNCRFKCDLVSMTSSLNVALALWREILGLISARSRSFYFLSLVRCLPLRQARSQLRHPALTL